MSMGHEETRIRTSRNVAWIPRPGWATVRLVGTCADPSLRRGQVVVHSPSEEHLIPGQDRELGPGTTIIVLSDAAHLVEDDLHLVPEIAVVAVGEDLP
jgi:hypothetical protein